MGAQARKVWAPFLTSKPLQGCEKNAHCPGYAHLHVRLGDGQVLLTQQLHAFALLQDAEQTESAPCDLLTKLRRATTLAADRGEKHAPSFNVLDGGRAGLQIGRAS